MSLVMGLDATRTPRGVIAVSVRDDHLHEVRLHPTLDAALAAVAKADTAVIDLPIGHDDPEGRQAGGRRAADTTARAFVGPREGEVPLVPPFIIFHADTLEEACAEAEGRGWPAPTERQWAVRDRLLVLQQRVRDHPQLHEGRAAVSFQALHLERTGAGHLRHPAHYWSGLHERLTLLHEVGLRPTRSFGGIGRMDPSDVVAATGLAWSAMRMMSGKTRVFPEDAPQAGVRIIA